jgi:peptidoglycan/LPS O-acetylase OafA/YrhL
MREIRSLTALRGIAALWVVLFHYQGHISWVPGLEVIRQGTIAVDIFFTLSGFILVYVYGEEFNLPNFWLKRFARLYPVHLVTLLVATVLIAGGKIMGFSVVAELTGREFVIHLFALHSFGLTNGLALNYPSWSISAEFSAYLVFPFIVKVILRNKLRLVAPVLLAFFLACVFAANLTGLPLTDRTYNATPLRIMPEFLLGMLSARFCLEERVSRSVTALIAVGLLVCGLVSHIPLMIVFSAPFLVAALFLYDPRVPAPLHYLGLISYSLYMIHALVEKVGFTLWEYFLEREVLPFWVLPFMIVGALIAASVVYHLVEVPGRRYVMSTRQKMVIPPKISGIQK